MREKLPKPGDRKTETFFALCPVIVNDEKRWLERVTIEYRYGIRYGYTSYTWIPIRFIDEGE